MFFDEAARDWDTKRRQERAQTLAAALLTFLDGKCGTVLDFGCGTGLLAHALSPHVERMYAYDPSREMRTVCASKSGAQNLRILEETELPDQRYDAIFSSMVLHHIRDTRAALTYLKSLLAPGGRLLIIDLDSDDGAFHKGEPGFDGNNGFDRADLCASLTACGFRSVIVETVYEGVKEIEGIPIAYSLFLAVAQ